jgi:DNA repair protein RadA/Sms
LKKRIIYECSNCGTKTPKWSGKCSNCEQWNTLIETVEEFSGSVKKLHHKKVDIYRLSEIDSELDFRIKTNIVELDRVLGGGIIPGSLILVGGDPGIGKSTLMLQMASNIINFSPLYITGEESLKQIKYRSTRLQFISEELMIIAETDVDNIINAIKSSDCKIAIIDSIQSVFTSDIESTAGSISQVRECANKLQTVAKQTGTAIFIIGHVTKDGFIAGPKILEHSVDTVIQFEGEKNYSYRILRALKNRFGSTNEIGIFEMVETGLKEVLNPSEVFLAQRTGDDSGIAVVAALEGSRPLLLEVQALVSPSGYSVPQRTSTGFDSRRLQMILAIVEKRLGMQLRNQDVFVNIAGGIYLNDTSLDLGIAAAIVSSFREEAISHKIVLIGEIGLTGEVRAVSYIEQRISEAEKLGFESAIVPKLNFERLSKSYKIKIIPVDRISLALAEIF